MSLDETFELGAFRQKNCIPDQAHFDGFCLAIGSRKKLLKALPALFSPVAFVGEYSEAFCFPTIREAIDVAGQVGHNSTIMAFFSLNGESLAWPLMDCSLIPYDFVNSYFEAESLLDWERIQLVCFKYGVGWIDDSHQSGTGAFKLRNDLYLDGRINYVHCIDYRLVQIKYDDEAPCVFGYNKLKIEELEQYMHLNALPELSEPL